MWVEQCGEPGGGNATRHGVRLAWWRRVHHIETLERIVQRIGQNERERILMLAHDVHTDHIETGTVIAHGTPTTTTEQIKQ